MDLRSTAAGHWLDRALGRSAKWPDVVEINDITLDALPPKTSKGNLVLSADPPFPLLGHFRYGAPESDLRIRPFDQPDDTPVEVVDEPVIYGGLAFRQFGHAIAESIHRLWPRFARKDLAGAKIAFLPVRNAKIMPYMIEALNLHGISRAEVMRIDRPMRFTQLFVGPQARQMCGPTVIPAYQKMLDQMLSKRFGPRGGEGRVYLSRAHHSHTGSFYGESLIERVLKDLGFEIIYPEQHTLTELVRILRSASLAVFAEGSAVHALELCGSATPAVFIISRRGASVARFAPLLSAICRKWMVSDHLVLNIGMASDFKKHSGLIDLHMVLDDLWAFSGLSPQSTVDAQSATAAIVDDLERHIADPRVERRVDHDRRAQEVRQIVAAALGKVRIVPGSRPSVAAHDGGCRVAKHRSMKTSQQKEISVSQVAGIGNCQVEAMARLAAGSLGMAPTYLRQGNTAEYKDVLRQRVADASIIFATRGPVYDEVVSVMESSGRKDLPVLAAPRFYFAGFHPDIVAPALTKGRFGALPMGGTQSGILLAAWREGLSEAEAISLFREEVYEALGYFDAFNLSKESLIRECGQTGLDVAPLIPAWLEKGPFVYMPNHPRIDVLGDMVSLLMRNAGLRAEKQDTAEPVTDLLAEQAVWPVYPEIAREIGLKEGSYEFRKRAGAPMGLEAFVEATYAVWRTEPPHFPEYKRMDDPRSKNISRFIRRSAVAKGANPYRDLGEKHWWSKAVAEPEYQDVDPAAVVKFSITKTDRVATAGSCFAQHISSRLSKSGFQYLVTETAPAHCPDPIKSDYGVFSARFGNIYTVRQLLQLADRAYGDFLPALDAWPVPSGFVDPFRPRVAGNPFASMEELVTERDTHFAAVRQMLETCDVFVFTLGLTEAWRSKVDGAIVPLPPGVVGAEALAHAYEPQNFTVSQVIKDLERLVELLARLNPEARLLLTVSPVPLIATHQDQHVLEATTYSKSALRAAAGDVANAHGHVAYFPSYEIITGSYNRGRYFAEDLRSVTQEGVDHVMRVFMRHFAGVTPDKVRSTSLAEQFRSEAEAGMEIVCDEAEIGQV